MSRDGSVAPKSELIYVMFQQQAMRLMMLN